MPAHKADKSILLRGYIEQVGKGDFFAICLTTNVCTRGSSIEEAEQSLYEAVGLYLKTAVAASELDHWVPRRAPLYHYLRYLQIWLQTKFHLPRNDVQLMTRVMHA